MGVTDILRGELAFAMGAALVLSLALLALRPADRHSVRNALLLLGACAFIELGEAWMRASLGRPAPAIVTGIASVLTGLVLIRLVAMFTFRVVLAAAHAQPARIVEDLVTAGVFFAWILAWLRMSGVDLASLVATSAVLTAVIAFSMQETLGNVLGGVVLQLDRSIRAGEWVRVDDVSGRVVEIGWRHTAIETRGGETVVIPNGWLMKNRFTVVGSRADPRSLWRRTVVFHVEWAAPPTSVCDTLERSVLDADIAEVAPSPPPSAILMDATADYGRYALRYWLTDPRADDGTDSRVRMHALAALQRRGFKHGVAQEERVIIKDNDAHREAAHAIEHARRVAALGTVELFAALSATEREALASHLVHAPFVAGDVMTRQGAVAHWLYLIVSGEAQVWREGPNGREPVTVLKAGSVFGEMGLMTGEPRRATVTARTDVVCYRLDKAGFEIVIKARPDIAEAISRVLSTRESELAALRGSPGAVPGAPTHAREILGRMRRFFGIEA